MSAIASGIKGGSTNDALALIVAIQDPGTHKAKLLEIKAAEDALEAKRAESAGAIEAAAMARQSAQAMAADATAATQVANAAKADLAKKVQAHEAAVRSASDLLDARKRDLDAMDADIVSRETKHAVNLVAVKEREDAVAAREAKASEGETKLQAILAAAEARKQEADRRIADTKAWAAKLK